MNFRNRYSDAAWQSAPDTTCLALLLALAKSADWETGGRCWPSIPTLADLIKASPATVRRALARLEAEGWLRQDAKPGRTTVYVLLENNLTANPLQIERGAKMEGVADCKGYQNDTPPLSDCKGTPFKMTHDHSLSNQSSQNTGEAPPVVDGRTPAQRVAATLAEMFSGHDLALEAERYAAVALELLRQGGEAEALAFAAEKVATLAARRLPATAIAKALESDARRGGVRATAKRLAAARVVASSSAPAQPPAPAQPRPLLAPHPDAAPTPEQVRSNRTALAAMFGEG